ncbi:Fels-1 Prophage Protein-like protein [compost metagenome]
MNKTGLSFSILLLMAMHATPASAERQSALCSPEPGVLCDRYVCADDKGISRALTGKHVGKNAASKLVAGGDFDPTEFTFANGIFCDVKERLCREDRYFDAEGKRSGAVTRKYSEMLFGQRKQPN